MLSCSKWFSAPSFWKGGGLESRCVDRVYGVDGDVAADGAAQHHLHRTHKLCSSSQHHRPSKNMVQKTVCCNSTSNDRDDGHMYLKHIELRKHQ